MANPRVISYFCNKGLLNDNDMATSVPKPAQLIITLEDDALIADIKKALKLIRGVTSVRVPPSMMIRPLRPLCAVLSIRLVASRDARPCVSPKNSPCSPR